MRSNAVRLGTGNELASAMNSVENEWRMRESRMLVEKPASKVRLYKG